MSFRCVFLVLSLAFGCSSGGMITLPGGETDGAAGSAALSDGRAGVQAGGTAEAGATSEPGAGATSEPGAGTDGADSAKGGARCRVVTTDLQSPHSAQFLFSNRSHRELFLSLKCLLDFTVRACSDGFDQPLTTQYPPGSAPCGADLPCGAVTCHENAPKIVPSGSIQAEWSGRVFALTAHDNCSCFDAQEDAKPGIYRVEIPVFESAAAVSAHDEPLFTAQAEFELPRPDDAPVEVELKAP